MRIEFKKLNHIQVCIPFGAEAEAREFYGGVLGLEEIEKPDELKPNGGLWFEIADIQLHIGVEDFRASSKRHPAFEVTNLDDIRTYLSERDVKIKEEVSVGETKRLSFFDPFGNRIELMENSKG